MDGVIRSKKNNLSVPWVKADSLKTKNLCYVKEPIKKVYMYLFLR